MLRITIPFMIIAISGALMLSTIGCGNGDTTAKYIPAPTVARDAVQTALTAWKSGAALKPIETSKPAINVFDMRWQEGKKLESFEIIEQLTGQEYPSFSVKIKLDKKPEEKNTYLVVGIDPLLVFRDTDYKKTTGQ